MALQPVDLSFRTAAEYVDRIHRHHLRPQGYKFAIGATHPTEGLVGVVIVGRPVAKAFDDGRTFEVTRLATNGHRNACSFLYARAWESCQPRGVERLITYTQGTESGASLRAVGWTRVTTLPPRKWWDTPSRRREDRGAGGIARVLWEIRAKAADRPETRPKSPRCSGCGQPIDANRIGRPRQYCTEPCRRRAYRRRGA